MEQGKRDAEMIELKACPLCGNKANLPKWFATNPEGFGIECSNMNCCEGIYGYDTEKEAIEAWQFRPLEDALTACITELESRLARLEEAGDAIRDDYIDELPNDKIDSDLLTAWQRAKEEEK